ncbi:MAG TPA: hypothetical protein PKE66_00280 [Pyrinomonadaceae bacterium]|nr:hypothetical protein [Pyrinomonadaceae bacterium]
MLLPVAGAGARATTPRDAKTTDTRIDSKASQATVAKDSVQVNAFTLNHHKGNSLVWSWVPKIEYSVNGPIVSGDQLNVEFSLPNGPWLRFDCRTQTRAAKSVLEVECGGREIAENNATTQSGQVDFRIKMRNELAGTDNVLFSGKFKVGKAKSNQKGPKGSNYSVFYVDHDWNLPIGYVFYEYDERFDFDDPRRIAKPTFNIAIWTRGESSEFAVPHIFYKGSEVGKMYYNGQEMGTPNCSVPETENNTTQITEPAGQYKWIRWKCAFSNVIPWNRSTEKNETMFGRLHLFIENPGEYEIKIIRSGRLIRIFKFSVDRSGRLVDNGFARSMNLGSDRMIVPVQVLGDQDGDWDKMAWKSEAFYGNPLPDLFVP